MYITLKRAITFVVLHVKHVQHYQMRIWLSAIWFTTLIVALFDGMHMKDNLCPNMVRCRKWYHRPAISIKAKLHGLKRRTHLTTCIKLKSDNSLIPLQFNRLSFLIYGNCFWYTDPSKWHALVHRNCFHITKGGVITLRFLRATLQRYRQFTCAFALDNGKILQAKTINRVLCINYLNRITDSD